MRFAFPMSQTLQYACCLPRSLAITESNVLVYSALKFDPLLYHIRFFAGLIPGNDSRFAIFVGFIQLFSRLDYLYLYYSVYIQALDIDFSVTLRCFTRQLFETTKLPYDINIDFSGRHPPNYHKKWLLTKKIIRL